MEVGRLERLLWRLAHERRDQRPNPADLVGFQDEVAAVAVGIYVEPSQTLGIHRDPSGGRKLEVTAVGANRFEHGCRIPVRGMLELFDVELVRLRNGMSSDVAEILGNRFKRERDR